MEFRALYKEYKELVFNLALHYVQHVEDAEEVTQDVFVKVYDKMDTFRHEAQWKTWIYRITINDALDKVKARSAKKRRFWLSGVVFQPDEHENHHATHHHPGISLENKEGLKKIYEAILQLPEQQRTALILFKIENLTQKQAADIMNLKEKAFESLFYRAKNNLSKLLKQNEGK